MLSSHFRKLARHDPIMEIEPDIIEGTLILKLLASRIYATCTVEFIKLMLSNTEGYSRRRVLNLELVDL